MSGLTGCAVVRATPPFLRGRRVHIAGSASSATRPEVLKYAHGIVDGATRAILARGGGLVLGVGREPRPEGASGDSPALTFDWTALAAAADAVRATVGQWPPGDGPRIVTVSSEKGEREIPEDRRGLWAELLNSGTLRAERISAGARAATLIRRRQAEFGDVLVALGGGFGVEDLATLYGAQRRPVVPLDLSLGSSREDGTGGASKLAREARADPTHFIRLRADVAGQEGSRLAALSTRETATPSAEIVAGLIKLFDDLALPTAFYTRLVNQSHSQFGAVEAFFRSVVDPIVADAGYRRIEIGTDPAEHAFINVGIFEELHYAPLVIADITGERPNCFIELGYALGRGTRVLATAAAGTQLPFDQDKMPVHFWTAGANVEAERRQFRSFWTRYASRPPIVQ